MNAQPTTAELIAENQWLKQRLADAERELQEFAYLASHDLQEPLRKITAFGYRLQTQSGQILDPQGQDYLQRMLSAADRMQAMLNGLLTYSRVSTHGKPFQSVDLQTLVQQVADGFSRQLTDLQGHIVLKDLPTLDCDAQQIKNLFTQLIDNAIKFSLPGVPPIILIYAQQNQQETTILCKDNGMGFSGDQNTVIFEVFKKLLGHQLPGSGLGLSIARKIAERHHGRLHAKANPGMGATFFLTLPLSQPAHPDPAEAERDR